MSTIIDYIKWRGDLSFEQDGFNDFDNIVFSTISYVEMDTIFKESGEKELPLKYITEQYFRPDANISVCNNNPVLREAPNLMRLAAECDRYGQVSVRNYVSEINLDKVLQFAAMEFLLPDGSSYVAFRGTDDTIVGWKEDFMMAVTEVQAEKEATNYLEQIAEKSRLYRIGGHSKGGHLAVYASVCCKEELQKHILQVYSNDGPGFSEEFINDPRCKAIADRVMLILPEEAVVGMIMEAVGKTVIVKSENAGVLQHDLMSWRIDGMKFDGVASVSKRAKILDRAMTEWLADFKVEERTDFVEDLFAVLEYSGAETLTDITTVGISAIPRMTKRLNNLNPRTKEQVTKILKGVFSEWEQDMKNKDPLEGMIGEKRELFESIFRKKTE